MKHWMHSSLVLQDKKRVKKQGLPCQSSMAQLAINLAKWRQNFFIGNRKFEARLYMFILKLAFL